MNAWYTHSNTLRNSRSRSRQFKQSLIQRPEPQSTIIAVQIYLQCKALWGWGVNHKQITSYRILACNLFPTKQKLRKLRKRKKNCTRQCCESGSRKVANSRLLTNSLLKTMTTGSTLGFLKRRFDFDFQLDMGSGWQDGDWSPYSLNHSDGWNYSWGRRAREGNEMGGVRVYDCPFTRERE